VVSEEFVECGAGRNSLNKTGILESTCPVACGCYNGLSICGPEGNFYTVEAKRTDRGILSKTQRSILCLSGASSSRGNRIASRLFRRLGPYSGKFEL
jgi:hypothetical protein